MSDLAPGLYWVVIDKNYPGVWTIGDYGLEHRLGGSSYHTLNYQPGWYILGDEVPHETVFKVGPPIAVPPGLTLDRWYA